MTVGKLNWIMKKQIAMLVAAAGLATISAQAQGYVSYGDSIFENFTENNTCQGSFLTIACNQDVVFSACPALEANVATVPEPSTLALCAIGLVSLTIACRSFRQKV